MQPRQNSRTSATDPLRIDSLAVCDDCGYIGLTLCPGKKQNGAQSEPWNRDLNADLKKIKAFGAKALVTLMPDRELRSLQVPSDLLRASAEQLGIEWYQLPIRDAGIPDETFERQWSDVGRRLRSLLKKKCNIVIHCKGGLGRTGTIAARLLVEFGVDAALAIQAIRRVRRGAIETSEQERYVRQLKLGTTM